MRNFNVQFSGKEFPAGKPSSLSISSQDEVTAKAWAQKQLSAWKVEPTGVRCVVTEMFVPVTPTAPVVKPKTKR